MEIRQNLWAAHIIKPQSWNILTSKVRFGLITAINHLKQYLILWGKVNPKSMSLSTDTHDLSSADHMIHFKAVTSETCTHLASVYIHPHGIVCTQIKSVSEVLNQFHWKPLSFNDNDGPLTQTVYHKGLGLSVFNRRRYIFQMPLGMPGTPKINEGTSLNW